MSTTAPPAPPLNAADSGVLRVVLFGMPDAGKSSLLGALLQSTRVQDRLLQGRVLDTANGLGELWKRVYEERQRETLEEIVPYPVVFEPYSAGPDALPKLNAFLYDCDGRAANELLSQRKSLENDAKDGSLAQAVIDADALILPIDASARNEQVETDFREFVRFLRVLELHRGHRRAVGGLPVFLVLTKCDLLARHPLSRAEWERKIEERRKQVEERFARYLESNAVGSGGLLTFGSIDLHVRPTAVKRPELTDAPASPREPLGVAELFRDCFHSAYTFHRREASSNRRLTWTVAGAGGFIAAAAALAISLITTGGPAPKPQGLIDKVEQFQEREKPLPDRLANDYLQRRKRELDELRDSPEFDRLPDDKRDFVRGRIDELQNYLRYREQLAQVATADKARNLTELDQIKERLETQAAIPEKYRADWEKTSAGLERARRLEECQTLRKAVDDELRPFYVGLKNKGTDLLFAKELEPPWEEQVNALFALENNPPVAREEPIKGAAFEFDEVALADKEWQAVRQRLIQVRDMGIALGALGDPQRSESVLAIAPAAADANLNSLAAARLEGLEKFFPKYKLWSLSSVPDDIKGELTRKLRRSYEQWLRDSQRMILAKYRQLRPSGEDTPKDWNDIADWLLQPELKQWHELTTFLSKLLEPAAGDPVETTAEFLRKKTFDIQIRFVTLSIPNNLPQGPLAPTELLKVHLRTQGTPSIRSTLAFRIIKGETVEGTRDKKYRYVLDEGDGRLTFKPGDEFGAELRAMKGDKPWQFTWLSSRTASFAFEALSRPPTLQPVGSDDRGPSADGVTLLIEGKFPTVPALIPDVRRDRK